MTLPECRRLRTALLRFSSCDPPWLLRRPRFGGVVLVPAGNDPGRLPVSMSDALFVIRILAGLACLIAWIVLFPMTPVWFISWPGVLLAVALPVAGYALISQR